jgi:hypothetical protein
MCLYSAQDKPYIGDKDFGDIASDTVDLSD